MLYPINRAKTTKYKKLMSVTTIKVGFVCTEGLQSTRRGQKNPNVTWRYICQVLKKKKKSNYKQYEPSQ